MKYQSFNGPILIYGVNPYMVVPEPVLAELFVAAGKNKGPIPVRGTLEGHEFIQTVVKYRGEWMLHLNGLMRKAAGVDTGDQAVVELAFDPRPRTLPMNPLLGQTLAAHPGAKIAFEALSPSRQHEILRYLASNKTQATLERNVEIVVGHLLGRQPAGLSALMRVVE